MKEQDLIYGNMFEPDSNVMKTWTRIYSYNKVVDELSLLLSHVARANACEAFKRSLDEFIFL